MLGQLLFIMFQEEQLKILLKMLFMNFHNIKISLEWKSAKGTKEFKNMLKKVSYHGVEMMMNAMIQDGITVDTELLVLQVMYYQVSWES